MGQQDFTQWQADYSVGNWLLNNQHKVLLGFCRQTIDCVPDDRRDFVGPYSTIRDDFLASVEEHFRTEESLLRNCAYPLLEQHKNEHSASQTRLTDFLMSTSVGEIDKKVLHDFLSDWWFHHVLDSDKKFTGSIQRVR